MAHCQKAVEKYRKHEGDNDLILFVREIIDYVIEGITASGGGQVIQQHDQFHLFDYWREKIRKYGFELVKFLDRCMINGLNNIVVKCRNHSLIFCLSG